MGKTQLFKNFVILDANIPRSKDRSNWIHHHLLTGRASPPTSRSWASKSPQSHKFKLSYSNFLNPTISLSSLSLKKIAMADFEEENNRNDGSDAAEKPRTRHKGKHDKDKPWDDPSIDHWKIDKFDPSWNEGGMLEVSSFSTLFPQYRGSKLFRLLLHILIFAVLSTASQATHDFEF